MSRRKQHKGRAGLTVDYAIIGVMTIDEFKQALLTDLQILKEEYKVKYIKAPKLKIDVTDAFGEPVTLRRGSDGKPIYRLHTHHYRPACMDYDFS